MPPLCKVQLIYTLLLIQSKTVDFDMLIRKIKPSATVASTKDFTNTPLMNSKLLI